MIGSACCRTSLIVPSRSLCLKTTVSASCSITLPVSRRIAGRQQRPLIGRYVSRLMCSQPPSEPSNTPVTNNVIAVPRAIVVAVDETEDSVKALNWTIDNFYRDGDVLHLLHVIPFVHQQVLSSTVYYTPPVLDPEITEQLYRSAEDVVNSIYIPVLEDANIKYAVDMVEEKGSETIGDAVCHAASNLGACVVVVASHKKHWMEMWLMGSSSREIAGKAPVPVIVYHG